MIPATNAGTGADYPYMLIYILIVKVGAVRSEGGGDYVGLDLGPDNGGALFFSTHVLEVAEKLCDKVAIIKGGKLIRQGTMDEVKGDESLEDVFLELEE